MRNLVILLLSFLALACSPTKPPITERPITWSQKLDTAGFGNFYKVDSILYRSEQPHTAGMTFLAGYGIKTVINLRHTRSDKREARKTNLILTKVSINTWRLSYDDIVNTMKVINTCEKPVLIHCLHGSDRTGCMVAAYRMVFNGWTKEEAIREFREGGYGYHEKWFPGILNILKSLDVEKLKKDAGVK